VLSWWVHQRGDQRLTDVPGCRRVDLVLIRRWTAILPDQTFLGGRLRAM
jgi:hypothetical protein